MCFSPVSSGVERLVHLPIAIAQLLFCEAAVDISLLPHVCSKDILVEVYVHSTFSGPYAGRSAGRGRCQCVGEVCGGTLNLALSDTKIICRYTERKRQHPEDE